MDTSDDHTHSREHYTGSHRNYHIDAAAAAAGSETSIACTQCMWEARASM